MIRLSMLPNLYGFVLNCQDPPPSIFPTEVLYKTIPIYDEISMVLTNNQKEHCTKSKFLKWICEKVNLSVPL